MVKFCKKCGAELKSNDSVFCSKCGEKVDDIDNNITYSKLTNSNNHGKDKEVIRIGYLFSIVLPIIGIITSLSFNNFAGFIIGFLSSILGIILAVYLILKENNSMNEKGTIIFTLSIISLILVFSILFFIEIYGSNPRWELWYILTL